MKSLIAIMAIVFSANTFAFCLAETGISTSYSPFSTSRFKEEATRVVTDAQELMQTGEMSAFLEQKINLIIENDSSLSQGEALDALLTEAGNILE